MLWVQPVNNQSVLTAAIESGVSTIVFSKGDKAWAKQLQQLARFESVFIDDGKQHIFTHFWIGRKAVPAATTARYRDQADQQQQSN